MNIKKSIFFIYTRCPQWLRDNLFQLQYHKHLKNVLNYWSDRRPEDPELAKALAYLKSKKHWTWFQGEYAEKYDGLEVKVDRSEEGFPFVQFDGKKLYFPKHFSKSWVRELYRSLMCEQDTDSPHRYFSGKFTSPWGGVEILLDVGAAEAIISLKYVEQVKRIIIFECDEEWIEALYKTFSPYQEKVSIVQKYVSNSNKDNCIRLDDYIANSPVLDGFNEKFLVKMDIEGAESVALEGSSKLLESRQSRFVVCTYHRPDDAQKFEKLFQSIGYKTQFSKGYMLWGRSDLGKPSFRKAVIQAWSE